jgi:serine/threonine protein kinase
MMASLQEKRPLKRKRSTTDKKESTRCSYGRCSSVTDRYEKLNKIGEGTYGVVYKAKDKNSGTFVALKRCLPHHESSDGFPVTTLREISTLRQCRSHSNIVQLLEVAVSSSRSGVFLVFEYCPYDLAEIIDKQYALRKKSPFSESQVKRLLKQLLSALDFLHSRKILHRDLKLSNMLYSDKGDLKLADFGLSRRYLPNMTSKVVSLWYRPPELLLGGTSYSFDIDMWGAGCAMAELLRGYPLWNGTTELEQLDKIMNVLGTPPPTLSHLPLLRDGTIHFPQNKRNQLWDLFNNLDGLALLSSLLQYDPTKRITADEAIKAPYLTTIPLPASRMPSFQM